MNSDADTGTDVSDVESTESASGGFQPEQLKNQHGPANPSESKHVYNRSGSMVIKHRTNSSLGNHLDLVNKMVSRWGSMGDGELDAIQGDDLETDSDYEDIDSKDQDGKPKKKKKKEATENKQNNNSNNNNNNNGDGGKQPTHRRKKSANDEMMLLKAEQQALEDAFDQYIDPEQNGDVDVEEWLLGLSKLNVQLNEAQQKKVYNFMDKDESGFIEKNDFVIFCTAKFDNEQLLTLQTPILEAVRVQNLHNRTHSNLMNPQLSQDWTDYDMDLLQQQMTQHMNTMVDNMKQELNEEQQFEEEMKKRMDDNPEIMNPENAFKWTPYEVVNWVNALGMERYGRYFQQENVDGPMLLEDITEELLSHNLGVRSIHAKKIMREITMLKKAVRGVTDLLLDESDFICTHHIEDIQMKIAQLQIKEELEKTRRKKDQLKKFYETEMKKLQQQIVSLKEDLNGGKKKKKKKKDKTSKQSQSPSQQQEMVIPQPPMDDDSTLISPDFGMGVPVASISNNNEEEEDIDETKQDVEQDMNEQDIVNNEDSNDMEETKEEVLSDELPVESQQQSQTRSSISKPSVSKQEEDSEDSDDDDDEEDTESESSDDEDSGRRILGMRTSHLMQLKRKKYGPSPKQINKFLKDLKKKKESMGDKFCIEDVDTIMEWTAEEVAYWIISIDFEQYAFAFYSLPIDGDMLIRDMNRESIIEDLGVKKIHSAKILRCIDKLRRIIDEGFDEDINEGITIQPDLERPTMEQIESLQERIEKLQQEREQIMQELESKNDDGQESGYFTKKIEEIEAERDELKSANDKFESDMKELKEEHESQIENLSNTLNEANVNNDELRKEIKQIKKDLRKAKRSANGDEDDYDDEEDEEEEEEEKLEEEVEINCSKEDVEQQILKEMDENDQFGLAENVLSWSPAEVCHWLKGLQFTPYMQIFYSAQIFGDVLTQDIGTKTLKKFKVGSMHIPKLLRQINELRKIAMDKGVNIELGEEVKQEMDPKYQQKVKEDKKKKKGKKVNNKKFDELEKILNDERLKLDELQKDVNEKEEQLQSMGKEYEEEKQLRIGFELELEQLKQEYENLMKTGSKQQIEKLENLVSSIEENKIRTVRHLNSQLNSLRIACRLMQKEIAFLKTKQGFHPIDSLVGALGYSPPPKY